MAVSLLLPQKRHPPKKKNAKVVTPVESAAKAEMVNAVKAVAKVVMVSAAKAATVAVVVTAAASAQVSATSATSAQKAHRQKCVNRVNPAPRVKVAATIAKVSVMLNGVVSALSAPRVNAVKP